MLPSSVHPYFCFTLFGLDFFVFFFFLLSEIENKKTAGSRNTQRRGKLAEEML